MRISFIILLLLLHFVGRTQFKPLPIGTMKRTEVDSLLCMDSTGVTSEFCSLGLDGFNVNLYKVFINLTSREARIIGRVCWSNKDDSQGVAGIEVFISPKNGNRLSNLKLLAETTDGGKFLYNNGFFDITTKVEKGDYLIFYGSRYFLREFKVWRLFNE